MESPLILVIDDDSVTRSLLGDILEHEGYRTLLVEDGRQAMTVLRDSTPDLIISDVLMPGMSGQDLFREVQKEPRLQSVPFIFLTALDDGDARIDVQELGPDDYISKPVRPRHLLATVRGKLRRKQQRDEAVVRERDAMRERIRWTLSHELRTPLTIIQGISELLLNERASRTAEEDQDLLQSLRTQSFQLGGMIENFLLVSRIDAGLEEERWKRDAEPLSLREVLDEAVFPWWEKSRQRGAEFLVDLPPDLPAVRACRVHLLEVFRQLLDNAFKFADPKQPRVKLSVSVGEESASVYISDNGAGISDAQQRLLFQKLSQVDRDVNEQQGSGLGLYITKKLLDLNQGAISLTSEPGRGVEIEVALALVPEKAALAGP